MSNWLLRTKLRLGFGVIAMTLIVVGMAGILGVNRLGNNLEYVLGAGWETADGAMETSINI